MLMWAPLIIDLSKSSNSAVFAQSGTAQDDFHLAGVQAVEAIQEHMTFGILNHSLFLKVRFFW